MKAADWTEYPHQIETSWDVSGGRATVYFDLLGEFVEHDDGTRSPREFTYLERSDNRDVPGWIIECEYSEELILRVRAVHAIARIGGHEVRSVDLRRLRPLDDVVTDAWRRVSIRPATIVKDGDPVAPRDPLQERTEMDRTIRGLRRQARRRVTRKLLVEVAAVYREHAAGGAPTRAVGEHFGIAPSTASLYVKRARDAGFDLPDPSGRRTEPR